jgi:cardiolipin synthase A/B
MPHVSTTAPARQQALNNNDFTFYTKEAYFRDIAARITATRRGDQIHTMTMSFLATDPGVQTVLQALSEAAGRGAAVTVAVDAHDFITGPHSVPGPLFWAKKLPEAKSLRAPFRQNLQSLQAIEAAGGRVVIINRPGRPLTAASHGRSHIKHTIINDRLYVGGCNLDTSHDADMMVGWDDAAIAEHLRDLTEQIIDAGNARIALHDQDLHIPVDPTSELLIDAGRPGQSLILDKALELIDQAETDLYITCQFFPNSRTLRHLHRAYRQGVHVTLHYNNPRKLQLPLGLVHRALLAGERLRLPSALTAGELPLQLPYLHAKLIASEKSAIIGSHNYVTAGVQFGTAEVALLRHDADFARRAVRAIQNQLIN